MAIVQPLFHTQQIIVSEGVSRNYIRLPYKVLLVQGEDYESPDELRTCAHIKEKFIAAVADDIGAEAPVTGLVAPLDSFEVNVQAIDWAYVIVTYSSSNAFGGGFRPRARRVNFQITVKRPRIMHLATLDTGERIFGEPTYVNVTRGAARKVYPIITGNWNDEDEGISDSNVGHVFHFGDIPYLFMGAGIQEIGNGQTLVEYEFYTEGPMREYDGEEAEVTVPALGFLDVWEVDLRPGGDGIKARAYTDIYHPGGTLPFTNIDGGGGGG